VLLIVIPLSELSIVVTNKLNNAENFVVNYEKLQFKSHELVRAIEKISDLNASAGYDIASLLSNESSVIDKFIEVKSYSGSPTFYWSSNEVDTAKKGKNKYFLYLVNRDLIDNLNYTPLMIQNPYKEIFMSSQWEMEAQNWKFQEIN